MPARKIYFALAFSLLFAACAASPLAESAQETEVVPSPEPTVEASIALERVEYSSADGTLLVGKVHLPEGEGPFPAVVYVHGSGRATRERGGSVVPALVEAGYAVLISDKRGVGESGGDYFGVNPTNSEFILGQLAEDAQAAGSFLTTLSLIDAERIGLFGNSQAGWIIPIAAGADEFSFAVILVGPLVSVGEENYYSGLTQENSSTLTDEKLESVSERLATFSGERGFDPRPVVEVLDIPLLWVFGGRDASIPTRESVAMLEEIMRDFNQDIMFSVYPTGTHGLQDADTGEQINFMDEVVLPWLAELMQTLP